MLVTLPSAHLLGAGLWLGALVPLLLVWHAAATNDTRAWHRLAVLATHRFSALGVIAVMTLALTVSSTRAFWSEATWRWSIPTTVDWSR